MSTRLHGLRVVVARPRAQAAGLIEALVAEGATAVPVPAIEIVDPPDGGAAMQAGLGSLGAGDWIVVTSPNGATRLAGALGGEFPRGVSLAVIGPGTRRRAEAAGLQVDLEPAVSIAEGLLDALPSPGRAGATMLLARAETARASLPDGLRARGWTVLDVAAYRTVGTTVSSADARACRHADLVAFTSASTVRHLHDGVGRDNLPARIACIGPATAAEAARLGLAVDIEAPVHTIAGLVSAIVDHCDDLVFIGPESAAESDSQWLLEQYFAEIDERFETGLDRSIVLTTDPEEISPPNGMFFVGRLGGDPVACGALKIVEPGVADIKRMWVSGRARGLGSGRLLLRRLVGEARALGLRRVRLETNRALVEAIALYRDEGFVEVEAFNEEPHADHWFVQDLD